MNRSKLLWPAGVGVVLLGVTLAMRTRSEQPASAFQAADTSRPAMSAPFLKRLAAATEGYRTGQVVWVVIYGAEPYTVKGVFGDRPTAEAIARAAGLGWTDIPVQTVREPGAAMFALIKHCYPSILPCYDPLARLRFPVLPADSVDSVSISIYPRGRPVVREKIDPRAVDAVFFNIGSIDKFAIPYYAGLEGAERAAQLRDSITHQLLGR